MKLQTQMWLVHVYIAGSNCNKERLKYLLQCRSQTKTTQTLAYYGQLDRNIEISTIDDYGQLERNMIMNLVYILQVFGLQDLCRDIAHFS